MRKLKYPDTFKLYPFQEETIHKTLDFFSSNPTRSCYVASSPGLGKSITSIVTANTMGAERVLIVCPSVMRLVWQQEIYAWSRFRVTDVPKVHVILSSVDADDSHHARWVIVSYDLTWRDDVLKNLLMQDFDLIIADEAHYLKAKSKRTTTFFKHLWPRAKHHLLLSGTPFTTNVVDCYRPFHYILPTEPTFHSFPTFVYEYSNEARTPWGNKYFGLKNADKLSKIIRGNFFVRYKKEDVLKDLPPVQHQKILLPPEYSIKMSDRDKSNVMVEKQRIIDSILHDKAPVITENLASLRRLQGEVKAPAVAGYAEDMLEQGIPVIIFAHHKSVIAKLMELLAVFNPVSITGETKPTDRDKAIQAFQNGETDVIICNLVAGGVGITLTRATDVLLCEAAWTASENNQAISRAHRIGTKGCVNVHWFIVVDSIDEDILNVVLRRTKEFSKVFDSAIDNSN